MALKNNVEYPKHNQTTLERSGYTMNIDISKNDMEKLSKTSNPFFILFILLGAFVSGFLFNFLINFWLSPTIYIAPLIICIAAASIIIQSIVFIIYFVVYFFPVRKVVKNILREFNKTESNNN